MATLDAALIEGIADDLSLVDGGTTIKLTRTTDTIAVDFTNGTATATERTYTIANCLVRQIADRDNRAVKQLRLFMQSVQNDEFPTLDTIIEIPVTPNVTIRSSDSVEDLTTGVKYTVTAVDLATLRTRWRIGARKIQ